MNINNSSPNNFNSNVHESNLQTTTATQAYDTYDTYTHATYSNNVNNAIFDQQSQQQSMLNNNTNQQSTSNNVSLPQQNQPSDSSQSNILPLLNSFGINISSPQSTIIIMPTTNSDIQNQLQQAVLAYLNHLST
ncbi:9461_t:CDS:2 [Rhizophagus irregularis]|nr:9461_t:CDS:2 [Rhizophagus irregularis]